MDILKLMMSNVLISIHLMVHQWLQCVEYQKEHQNVSLVFVTPYMTMEYQKNYLELYKKLYDEIVYPDIEDKPMKFAISYRNRWMVEKSDFVICYIDCDYGGAYQTYKHAKRQGKLIFNLSGKEIQ